MVYNLLRDEYVILKDTEVEFEGTLKFYATEIIITNKNIICDYDHDDYPELEYQVAKLIGSEIRIFVSKNIDEDEAEKASIVFPLNKIKVFQGMPQIMYSEEEEYFDIFFYDLHEKMYISNYIPLFGRDKKEKAKEKIANWENTLKDAVLKEHEYTKTNDNRTIIRRFCPTCGNEIQNGFEFCPKCGSRISSGCYLSKEEQEELISCLKKLFNAGFLSEEEFCNKERSILSMTR